MSITLTDAVELAFLDLEESYECSWRSGKGSRESLIAAFSQRDKPPYKYLGYEGSDGLRHVFGRSIPDNDKPNNVKWEDWVLNRIGMYYCSFCNTVHDSYDKHNICPRQSIEDEGYKLKAAEARIKVSNYICQYLSQNPCECCGEKDIVVLEFDHIDPSTKSFDIGNRGSKGIQAIKEEIAKCRVLCANCHRRHTAATQGHHKWLFSQKLNT